MDAADLPPPPPPSSQGGSAPAPPPPPLPGPGAKIPTWRETQEAKKVEQEQQQMNADQYSNLPPQLMNSMSKDKKPFTYTPLAVGDKGKLDLSQIRSPRMKKRLMANMKEEEEEEANGPARPSSDSPCSFGPSPLPGQPSSLTDVASSASELARNMGQPKVFKIPPPRKIDFTEEIFQRQREKQTPGNVTSSNYITTSTPPIQNPMSNVHLETIVNEEIQGLADALGSKNVNFSPQSNYYHPLADVKRPSSFYQYNNEANYPAQSFSQRPNEVPSGRRDENRPPSLYSPSIPLHDSNNYGYQHSPQVNYEPCSSLYNTSGNFSPCNQPLTPSREVFNVQPPKKIDFLKELEQQSQAAYSGPTKILGPSLGEQWAQKKQHQSVNQNSPSQYEPYPHHQPAQSKPQHNQSYCRPANVTYDEERSEPTQSRSFKVLQKLTEGIEDEIQNLKLHEKQMNMLQQQQQQQQKQQYSPSPIIEPSPTWNRGVPVRTSSLTSPIALTPDPGMIDPRYRGANIPGNSFRYLQDLVGMGGDQGFGNTYQRQYSDERQSDRRKPRSEIQIPIMMEGQMIPASQQEPLKTPPQYSGASIPSRSFRRLQMMTGEQRWESSQSIPPYGTDF